MAAATFEDAVAAVEDLRRLYRQRFGLERDVDGRTTPFLARVLVLANRNRLTNREVRECLRDDYSLLPLISQAVRSPDEQERDSASLLQNWFAEDDEQINMARLFIRHSAKDLLEFESSLDDAGTST